MQLRATVGCWLLEEGVVWLPRVQAALTGLGGFEKGGGREVWVGGGQSGRRRKKELEAGRSGGVLEELERRMGNGDGLKALVHG